jgi:hypothetical protein
VPRIRKLADTAETADTVHVLLNNCCGDASAAGARTLAGLLAGPPSAGDHP